MKEQRRVSLRKTLSNLDLSEIEERLYEKYQYKKGKPGRPPQSPTGLFLCFILMFLRLESYRDFQAFLEKEQFWRRYLRFSKTPDIGTFSHFLKRIGEPLFEESFNQIIQQLLKKHFLSRHCIAIDGSIIESKPEDKQASWGWDHINKCYVYGYKIHVIVDTKTELPLAFFFTKANVHDSQAFTSLYNQVKSYDTRFRIASFLADKGYDSSKIRQKLLNDEVRPIIKMSKTRIKPHYPTWFQEKYCKRTSVERFFSRLKTYLDLKRLNLKGMTQLKLATYIISIGMLLIAYLNNQLDCSPRSIKSFMRRWM
jgi:transposase, IS5 family